LYGLIFFEKQSGARPEIDVIQGTSFCKKINY